MTNRCRIIKAIAVGNPNHTHYCITHRETASHDSDRCLTGRVELIESLLRELKAQLNDPRRA